MKKVLTIAGTDPTGGAGVQADLKTMTAHKVYGMSIITALVAQNTLGVRDIMEVKPDFLAEQFDCVFEDTWLTGEKINNPNTHGTGCTLSSAIASNLALEYSIEESVTRAKVYITGALKANLNLGHGSGPLDHCWNINQTLK